MRNLTILLAFILANLTSSTSFAQCGSSKEFQRASKVFSEKRKEYYWKGITADFEIIDTTLALAMKKAELEMTKNITNEADLVSYLSWTFDTEYFFTGKKASERYTTDMRLIDFEESNELDKNQVFTEALKFVNSQIGRFEIYNCFQPNISLKKKFVEYSNYELFILYHLLNRYSKIDWMIFFNTENDNECIKIKNRMIATGCEDYITFGKIFIVCDCDKIHGTFILEK